MEICVLICYDMKVFSQYFDWLFQKVIYTFERAQL